MHRRAFVRWGVLAPVGAVAAPTLAKIGAVVSRVAPRTPLVEWVWEPNGATKSLVIDHVEIARFPRGVQLTAEAMTHYLGLR